MNSLTIQDASLDELPDNIQDPSLDELLYNSGSLFR
jgi:hypothetical protein